jgi:hypothetical protein
MIFETALDVLSLQIIGMSQFNGNGGDEVMARWDTFPVPDPAPSFSDTRACQAQSSKYARLRTAPPEREFPGFTCLTRSVCTIVFK